MSFLLHRNECINQGCMSVILLLENGRHFARLRRRRRRPAYVRTYLHILYLNTIWFKAESLWGRVKVIANG